MARTRTFLAIDVNESIRQQTQAIQAVLAATGAAVRWVTPKNLHITLQYLGDVSDRDLAEVCRLVPKASAKMEAFRITVAGLGAFPNPRRPKVLWAGVDEGRDALLQLYATIAAPLEAAGLYRPEDRPYTPHLTLGRVVSDTDGGRMASMIAEHRDWTAGVTIVDEVLILASELRRSGPEYSVIGRCPLR